MNLIARKHCPTEWSFASAKHAEDAWDQPLDVHVTEPGGETLRVPAFWAGESTWRVRFAPRTLGKHTWRSEFADASDAGLHGVEGTLEAVAYEGANPLMAHGPVQVAADQRHLAHADGTQFFWLADTWWMGLCRRLEWPDGFQSLATDRVAKGFTVVQIVAGLYPDMGAYDPRGANEAGYPWAPEWSRIDPAYFDMADLRIRHLVSQGISPCIVGCWGYYVHWLGVERMKQHWRNLIARWAAYPVTWCLAGEVRMPWYREQLPTPEAREDYAKRTKEMWSDVARSLRATDPYRRPLTAHPGGADSGRDTVADELIDFDMLQTGHGDRASLPSTVEFVTSRVAREPAKPVLDGEVCYESIGEASREEVQRLMFWVCMLNGACGHTYGANGIWQLNSREHPYGASPHGMSWGGKPWSEAAQLAGSRQVGLAKALLTRYRWWLLEPHPEWTDPAWSKGDYVRPYCAGVPGQVRLVFLPSFVGPPAIRGLEPGVTYRASWWNPATAVETEISDVIADADGNWRPPQTPIFQDWVLLLEAPGARV